MRELLCALLDVGTGLLHSGKDKIPRAFNVLLVFPCIILFT